MQGYVVDSKKLREFVASEIGGAEKVSTSEVSRALAERFSDRAPGFLATLLFPVVLEAVKQHVTTTHGRAIVTEYGTVLAEAPLIKSVFGRKR